MRILIILTLSLVALTSNADSIVLSDYVLSKEANYHIDSSNRRFTIFLHPGHKAHTEFRDPTLLCKQWDMEGWEIVSMNASGYQYGMVTCG